MTPNHGSIVKDKIVVLNLFIILNQASTFDSGKSSQNTPAEFLLLR